MNHYHVAVASRDGMILNESRFDEPRESARVFINLIGQFFNGGQPPTMLTEDYIMEYALDQHDSYNIYLDCNTAIRIYWMVCAGCKTLPIHN